MIYIADDLKEEALDDWIATGFERLLTFLDSYRLFHETYGD